MAISVDATSHATVIDYAGSTPQPLTWSHTCGAGTTKLVVQIAAGVGNAFASNRDVSGITFNGVALTKLTDKDDANFLNVEIWRLDNPPITTANIVATFVGTESAAHTFLDGGAISLIGAAVAGEGTPQTASATTANPSVTLTTTSGDYCIGVYASDLGPTGTSTPNGTQIWEDEDFGSDVDFGANYVVAAGSSTAVTWTAIGGDLWALAAVPITAAAGGGAVTQARNLTAQTFMQMRR